MQKKTSESFTELKGGDRLYNLFKKKMEKNPTGNVIQRRKFKNPLGQPDKDDEKDLCITIPLKGAKGGVSMLSRSAFIDNRDFVCDSHRASLIKPFCSRSKRSMRLATWNSCGLSQISGTKQRC